MDKKYYKDLDILRAVCCIAVFLYHLGLLKGGYLAVCSFFVLSGYLSTISAFKKEKFSIKDYYISRLLHIYLPLAVVVLISVFVISLIPNTYWFNLKPETTSVLVGYNNYWQIGASVDYFARHTSSPFMHFWYIAILLQFELIFPFVFLLFKKIGEKIHSSFTTICLLILSLASTFYFYQTALSKSVMFVYYDSLSRAFSIFWGLLLGFIVSYYHLAIPKLFQKRWVNRLIFYFYLIVLIILMCIISSTSKYFGISMILVSLITTRLIAYGTQDSTEKISIISKIMKSIASISYEVYLIQYPVIYIIQNTYLGDNLKIVITIIITIILSYLFNFALNLKRNNKDYKYRYCIFLILICLSTIGLFRYVTAKDYTLDMQKLEEQLNENAQLMENKQLEYEQKVKEEQEALEKKLKNIDNLEEELKGVIYDLPLTIIGDSVMLGAMSTIYEQFPNSYVDADKSRTAWVAYDILINLEKKGILYGPIVMNFGANGDCPESCKKKIMSVCGDRKVFWLNTTNDKSVHVNEKLDALALEYDNLTIIDWNSISSGHSEYFIADGIHLTNEGKIAYTDAIYNALYEDYLKEYNKQTEEILKEYENSQLNKTIFYGNDLLLNAIDYFDDDFKDAKYIGEYNFEHLVDEVKEKKDTLPKKVVFAFDNNMNLSINDYQKFINILNDHDIYIISMVPMDIKNATIIDLSSEIKEHKEYLMVDGIHLSEQGNNRLKELIKSNVFKSTNN